MNLLTHAQVQQLLQPIHPDRVLLDPRGNSHVSQQDVTAHLTRILGFGNYHTQIIGVDLIFEESRVNREGQPTGRWDVCYRALMRLTVCNPDGSPLTSYENGSTGTAQNLSRGDAHDNALKSAISLAIKRCAINLGDQFGLSLYNKGQQTALVRGTLIRPPEPEQDDEQTEQPDDIQDGVAKQTSLGHDDNTVDAPQAIEPVDPAVLFAEAMSATNPDELRIAWQRGEAMGLLGATDVEGKSLADFITELKRQMDAA